MKFQNCSFNCLKDTVGTKSVPTHVPYSWGHNDGLEFPMLHTKFCENRPADSGEEDF